MKLKEKKKKMCCNLYVIFQGNFKYSKFKILKICNQFGELLIYYTRIIPI